MSKYLKQRRRKLFLLLKILFILIHSSDSDDSSDDEDEKGAKVEFSDNENEYSKCGVDESANEPEVISEWETSIVYTKTDTELSSLD